MKIWGKYLKQSWQRRSISQNVVKFVSFFSNFLGGEEMGNQSFYTQKYYEFISRSKEQKD